jgi:hypothetical protein
MTITDSGAVKMIKRTTVSVDSLRAVIEGRDLRPDQDNNYRITGEMIAEAMALDAVADALKLRREAMEVSVPDASETKGHRTSPEGSSPIAGARTVSDPI